MTPRHHYAGRRPHLRGLIALGLAACGAPDTRIPRQVDAPVVSVVAPVIPEPRPAPPEPPPPPPPTDGAELFERGDWHERSLERVCQAVLTTTQDTHVQLARPTTPPSADDLVATLDLLATKVETTLDVMAQIAPIAPPPAADAARACTDRLAQAKAELFASPHIFRAFAAHAEHPRIAAFLATLRRAGADLPDAQRAQLATLQKEARRLQLDLESDTPLGELPRSTFAGLPDFLEGRAGDPLPLTRDDLDIARALVTELATLAPLRARASARSLERREPLVELLRTRQRIASLLGHPSFAHFTAAATRLGTPDAIARHLDTLRAQATPAADKERLALALDEGLDRALVQARTITRASEGAIPQHVVGPWPYRLIARPHPEPWWNALHAPVSTSWGGYLDAAPVEPLPEPRVPARALGLVRQLQLAWFWLDAHGLAEVSADKLDQLWAESLERFGLADLFPMAAWPDFDGLVSSPGYHLIIDAHLAALSSRNPGDTLERWLAPTE